MWEDLFGGMEGGGGAYSDLGAQLDPNLPSNFWDTGSLTEGFVGNGSIDVGGGMGGLGGLGGMLSNFLSNPKNLAGLASMGLGAAAGAQGNGASGPAAGLDPRLEPFIYGGGGIVPRAMGMLDNQIGAATSQGANMIGKGADLLGQPVAGNGFGRVQLNAPNTPTNPYLGSMADDISRRTQELLAMNNNSIAGRQVSAGGMGSTRMGVAQGTAAGDAADSLQGQLAGLYGNAYNQDQNRSLQQYGMDQSFYGNQRGQDLAGAQLGGNLIQSGFDTQIAPLNAASNLMKPYSNLTSANSSGSNWQGALGGALTGASLANKAGWW